MQRLYIFDEKTSNMKDMNATSKVITFAKKHWLFIFIHVLVLAAICVGIYYYIQHEVDKSKKSIESLMEKSYGDNEGLCLRDETSYTIVSYKLVDKPSRKGLDSSLYEQQYGGFNRYYVATNEPWDIEKYKYESGYDGGVIHFYYINPCAVGIKNENDNPEYEFRRLYNRIIDSYRVNQNSLTPRPENLKSKYHSLDYHWMGRIRADNSTFYLIDTLWYNYGSDKLFLTEKHVADYIIKENHSKIICSFIILISCFVLFETLLFALFWFFRKRLKKNRMPKQEVELFGKNNRNALVAEKPFVSDAEYDVLLHKINPINFMNPYDAERVKIANDLYSALLKSKDNDTIIRIIEEKAKELLNV